MPTDAPGDSAHPRVLIVGNFAFPYGTGASSRVFSYARGLQAAGARVKVLCIEPSERAGSKLNAASAGCYRGVPFEYTYGRTSRPGSRTLRRYLRIAKWWRFLRAVRTWGDASGGVDAVIVYTRSIAWITAAWVSCLLTDALLVHEECELPFVWNRESAALRARRWLYENVAFKMFDGCLVISTYLRDYSARHLRRDASTLLVPILVDVSDFANAEAEAEESDERIAFCGSLSHPEALAVVESFAAVAASFPRLELLLIGGAVHPEAVPELWSLVERLKLAKRVRSTGRVARDDLPALLRSARVLVLPRPAGAFSEAGLPTKVAEYLASGRPVVMTANGDIQLYLQNGVDAYLVPPDDGEAFAQRLRYVLEHPGEAAAVGATGRETARKQFDPSVHGARIIEFLVKLEASRRDGNGRPTRRVREGSTTSVRSPL